jgi:hypothetical protein
MLGGNVHRGFPPTLQFLFAEADVLHPHLQVLFFFHHDHDSFLLDTLRNVPAVPNVPIVPAVGNTFGSLQTKT